MNPVWKDIYVTAATQALEYNIRTGGGQGDATIFYGKAYALPGANNVSVNVTRIIKDYVSNELQSFDNGTYTASSACVRFTLWSGSTALWVDDIYLDWSYENVIGMISVPINGHYAAGQKIITTTHNQNEPAIVTNQISTASTSNYCGRYALLYLNCHGGWDSFLIEGNYKKKDTYKTFNTERKFNNTNQLQFGDLRYVNEISTEYELHTGWLTDTESAKLAKNLLASTRVYLQDIDGGTIIPVVITNTDAEYKKYKDDKELISYQIDVKESQVKERR